MRVTTTSVLGAIAVLLGLVIWNIDRDSSSVGPNSVEGDTLTRFDETLVDRITIEIGGQTSILEKQNGFWLFAQPEVDRADAGIINGLLDQLNHLTVIDTIESSDGELQPESIGLKGSSALKLSLEGPEEEGSKKRFEQGIVLGTDAPKEGALYAMREDEGEIFVVSGNPRSWLENPLATLRDSRLIGAPPEGVVQMVVRSSTGEVAMQRKITQPQQAWAITKPIQVWASRDVMDDLLSQLVALKVSSVEGEIEESEIPSPLPDDAIVVQMQVFGVEKPLTVYLKQVEAPPVEGAPALLEAQVSDRPLIFGVQSRILEKIPREPNDYRNRTLAQIPMAYLDSVIIKSLIDPDVYLKSERLNEGIRWDVQINNKLLPANLAKVSELVSAVNDAAIQDFASDTGENLEEFGLKPPSRRIAFTMKFPGQPDANGNPGQLQTVQRVLNLGWREGEEQRLFGNFEGEPHVYELDPSFFGSIPTHPIKWRSLSVLTFNPFHLKSITRDQPGREKLKLEYDYRRDEWEAFRNGVNVRPSLDVISARKLRDRLGSLTASGWYLSLARAYEALQSPELSFSIVTSELDPATGDSTEKTYKINFAKWTDNAYFGQVEGANDVFYLDRESFMDLKRPVTTSRLSNP